MDGIFAQLWQNHSLKVTLFAWGFAQTLKVALGVLRTRRFDFRWFIGTGGMPSAHAAGSSALAVVVGTDLGFDTPLFALAAVFAGVRRAAGTQASILNKILNDIYWRGKIEGDRLKELIGHTPVEVFAGSIIGILLALIF